MPRFALCLAAVACLVAPAPALATHAQPPIDREILKSTYKPNGFYKPGDMLPPTATELPEADANGLYNPSGHWAAYDTNVYETLNFPLRQANDASDSDPLGSGDPRHGWCPPDPLQPGYIPGRCPNHSLEYIAHYERMMKEVLKDFGVVTHRYPFNTGEDSPPVGLPGGLTTRTGDAVNVAAIVPGTDHPDEMVVMGAHFDQTDGGPASAWDSAEGHASMIRMAAIMAEYWKRTGTRPSATVVFIPWDAEEAGSLGSEEWLDSNVPPEEAPVRIRGYFNDDPCATGYPAYYHGNPVEQVPMVMQLTDPSGAEDAERVEAFNTQANGVVDEFFADHDDEVETAAGPMPVYTDDQRELVVEALGGLAAFSSDYGNFEAAGVPIFNLFPDILGPHADGSPGFSAEGVTILHTPRDNLLTWNAFTDADQTGLSASDGWMTGMEFCSQLYSRFMLQPNMGGSQAANLDPVAYFEALPNEAPKGKLVTFDAGGSYQYSSVASRSYVPEADLQFKWDFGDGSEPAYGRVVKHAYQREAVRRATLTVTNRDTHVSDSMSVAVTVIEGEDNETDPVGQNADPGLRPKGSIVACQSSDLGDVRVTPAGRGLRVDAAGKSVRVQVLQVAGRRLREVADFAVNGKGAWNGRGGASTGTFVVRVIFRGTGSRQDSISLGFERRGGKLRKRRPFQKLDTCDSVPVFRLTTPRFSSTAKLGIAFTLKKSGRARVDVLRGRKRVKSFNRRAKANRLVKINLSGRGLRRGEYTIVLRAGGKRLRLYARRA